MKLKLLLRHKHCYTIEWVHSQKEILNFIQLQNTFYITNVQIYNLYKKSFFNSLDKNNIIIIKEGEPSKQLKTIEYLAETLMKKNANRYSGLVAIGGGVIGDITGFLASLYMRGISFYQVPTSLLAMVDSSVGGKTGVNSKLGKNMIGTFYQPHKVLICVDFLDTLPTREIQCGLAEIVKSALIWNKKLYQYILNNTENILKQDKNTFKYLSYASIKIKKTIVKKDEKEKNIRALLNFGHTFAHALEVVLKYKKINHGEAVAIGLGFESYLSMKKKYIAESDFLSIFNTLKKLKLMTQINKKWFSGKNQKSYINSIIKAMLLDKKNKNHEIYFILLQKIGLAKLPIAISKKEIFNYLEEYVNL